MSRFVRMWDAAHPTFPWPRWLKIVAGYIGGQAEHVWTVVEWRAAGNRKKLPIWVAQLFGPRDHFKDAWQILQMCFLLRIPKGSPIVIDMETNVDAHYLTGIYTILHFFGYRVWVYGSRDFVFGNPRCDGYWVADFTNVKHMVPGRFVVATQDRDPGKYDTSCVKIWQYLHALKTW